MCLSIHLYIYILYIFSIYLYIYLSIKVVAKIQNLAVSDFLALNQGEINFRWFSLCDAFSYISFWHYPLIYDPQQLYTPPHIFFQTDTIERGANAVGMSIPPPATTERAPYKAHFMQKLELKIRCVEFQNYTYI